MNIPKDTNLIRMDRLDPISEVEFQEFKLV